MKQTIILILLFVIIIKLFKTTENMTSFKCKKNQINQEIFDCVKNQTIFESVNNIFKKYKYNAYKEYKRQRIEHNNEAGPFTGLKI